MFQFPMGEDSCKGFSLWDDYAPLVAINTWWSGEARIFTLFHEYGHLITRTNSACTGIWDILKNTTQTSVERWCEQYSASVLLPYDGLTVYLSSRFGWRKGEGVGDLAVVKAIAGYFKASLKASALRLIGIGEAGWELFRQIPRASENKAGGGGGSGRDRAAVRIEQYGHKTRELLFRAVASDILDKHDLLDYLNVSSSDLEIYEQTPLY